MSSRFRLAGLALAIRDLRPEQRLAALGGVLSPFSCRSTQSGSRRPPLRLWGDCKSRAKVDRHPKAGSHLPPFLDGHAALAYNISRFAPISFMKPLPTAVLGAVLGSALAIWAWLNLWKDEKPRALFLVAEDQKISAKVFCDRNETSVRMYSGAEEPSCKLLDFGVGDFDRQLETALKLDPLCNGLPILLIRTVEEATRRQEFSRSRLDLYVDYYPGQPYADWSLHYDLGYRVGLRGLLLDMIGRPGSQILRPFNRGSVSDIASEACSLADLKRGN